MYFGNSNFKYLFSHTAQFCFGDSPDIFAHIGVIDLLTVFDCATDVGRDIWETIFDRATNDLQSSNTAAFCELLTLMSAASINAQLFDVCLIMVEHLAQNALYKETYHYCREVMLQKFCDHYRTVMCLPDNDNAIFVPRALDGFVAVFASALAKFENSKETVPQDAQMIFKTFLREVKYYNDSSAIKLLNLALNHKVSVAIPDEEMTGHINRFWDDILRTLKTHPTRVVENGELLLKTILSYKSDEEFVDLLTADMPDSHEGDKLVANFCSYQHALISSIAKCTLNKSKGAVSNFIFFLKAKFYFFFRFFQIFHSYYTQCSFRLVAALRSSNESIVTNVDALVKLLNCDRFVTINVHMPISTQFVDDKLALLSEINIKNYNGSEENFALMHGAMALLAKAFVQNRFFFVADRIIVLSRVLRDLLQAICLYQGDQTAELLKAGQVTMLRNLAKTMDE